MGCGHSHLKHFTATPVHKMVTVPMTAAGIHIDSVCIPREAAFISCIPCVSGKKATILCIISGITSKGSLVPEKNSMGKYSRQAMTLAIFSFFAIPPTIIPMLNLEIRVRSQLPRNPTGLMGATRNRLRIFRSLYPATIKGSRIPGHKRCRSRSSDAGSPPQWCQTRCWIFRSRKPR